MTKPESQKPTENSTTSEQLEKKFLTALMEGAFISSFGAECCGWEDLFDNAPQ